MARREKYSRNVYAKTREECEEKLKKLILEMKAEIAAYLREHPGVSSKSMIARELQLDRSTVQRYYDEIQEKFQRQG